jgi:hypothetical protein
LAADDRAFRCVDRATGDDEIVLSFHYFSSEF